MGRKAREIRATVVRFFFGGRWDPPFASEQRTKVGIKVEHGGEERDICFWAAYYPLE